MLDRLVRPLGRRGLRHIATRFREDHLWTFAAAIAFRVLFAAVPFAMFVLGVLGLLHLDSVWSQEIAPGLKRSVSPPVFQVIDDAVRRALSSKQVFWATAGGAIGLWIASSAVRAAMDALDGVYKARHTRPLRQRVLRSLWLAAAVGACLVAAAAIVRLGPLALGGGRDDALVAVVSFVVRWGLAAILLVTAVFLVVRYAPATAQPAGWVSLGSGLSVAAWLLMSLGFGAYLAGVSAYGSVYGSMASVIVLFSYVYLSAIAFLFGVQVDALVREEEKGDPSGRPKSRRPRRRRG